MSQFNLKFLSSLLILGLGVAEILVFNEEVFIFVCFFIFFNLISIFAGNSITQAFQDISGDLEKTFLHTSKEAKLALSSLILSKEQALNSILRVLILFKAFRNTAIQKGLLSASESFVQSAHSCVLAFNAFKSRNSAGQLLPNPVNQALIINSKYTLKQFYSKEVSPSSIAKGFVSLPKPKQKARVIDRLLSVGFLSFPKSTLL